MNNSLSEPKLTEVKDERGLTGEVIQTQMKFFHGDILTIIDASFSDKEQRKAVKDLVNKCFRDKINHFWDLITMRGVDGVEDNKTLAEDFR